MLGAQGIRATGFKRAQGNAHCAKFESHTNRVTFETNAIMMIVKVHPLFTIVFLYKASKQEFVIFRILIKIELSWNQEDFLAENLKRT